jgi:hypothetical protein
VFDEADFAVSDFEMGEVQAPPEVTGYVFPIMASPAIDELEEYAELYTLEML